MEVNFTFLNGFINEDVYVSQPPKYEDHENVDLVFKLKMIIYGL